MSVYDDVPADVDVSESGQLSIGVPGEPMRLPGLAADPPCLICGAYSGHDRGCLLDTEGARDA